MNRRTATGRIASLIALSAILATGSSAQIQPGQVDTFSVGDTAGWQIGPLGATSDWVPTVSADGGPDGAGDAFLVARSSGLGGVGSKLVIYNEAQWTGDFLGAMISDIVMDVQNLGSESVMLRLYIESTGGGDWISVDSVLVEPASGWQPAIFSISETALTGGTDYTAAMQSVDRFRILHGPDRLFPPVAVEAEIGIDNIAAVPIDTGIEDQLVLSGHRIVSVYPNPTSADVFVTVTTGSAAPHSVDVGVFDLLGRRIADWSEQFRAGTSGSGRGGTTRLHGSLSDAPAGLYFIRVADATGVDIRPVVVANH